MDALTRRRMAHNFVERYGPEALRWLLDALAEGLPGPEIAARLDVSRERVRQWKNAFGSSVTLYQVHREVEDVLRLG